MHPLTVRRGGAWRDDWSQELDQPDDDQRVADHREGAEKPFGPPRQCVVRGGVPGQGGQQRLQRPHHADLRPELVGQQGSTGNGVENRGRQSKRQHSETPPYARRIGVGGEMRSKQPESEERPSEQRRSISRRESLD